MTTTKTELAALLGLGVKRIEQLQADGAIPKGAKFDLGQAVRGYVAFLKRARTSDTFRAERERKMKADADLAELEIAERRKQLVNVAELLALLTKFLVAAKARIYANQKLTLDEKDALLLDLRGAVVAVWALDPESGVAMPEDPIGETGAGPR